MPPGAAGMVGVTVCVGPSEAMPEGVPGAVGVVGGVGDVGGAVGVVGGALVSGGGKVVEVCSKVGFWTPPSVPATSEELFRQPAISKAVKRTTWTARMVKTAMRMWDLPRASRKVPWGMSGFGVLVFMLAQLSVLSDYNVNINLKVRGPTQAPPDQKSHVALIC